MTTKDIILKLPVVVVDRIGNMLSQHPYREVKDILDLIAIQANNPEIQGMIPAPPPAQEK